MEKVNGYLYWIIIYLLNFGYLYIITKIVYIKLWYYYYILYVEAIDIEQEQKIGVNATEIITK